MNVLYNCTCSHMTKVFYVQKNKTITKIKSRYIDMVAMLYLKSYRGTKNIKERLYTDNSWSTISRRISKVRCSLYKDVGYYIHEPSKLVN